MCIRDRFGIVAWNWVASGFAAPPTVLPVTLAAAAGVLGLQTVMGGFLVAIIGGHETKYIPHTNIGDYAPVPEFENAA